MKQTNNAIKFLMAQYRAIFKNANIAMVAAMVASALAAGQAQAADLTLSQDKAKPTDSLEISEKIDASGNAGGFVNNITIKDNGTLNFDGSKTVNKGHISVADTLTVESGGTLTLKGPGWGVIGTHDYDEKQNPLFDNANSTLNVKDGATVTVSKSQIQMTNVNLDGGEITIDTNHDDNANSDFADNAQINAITNAAGQGGVLAVNGATVNLNNGSILNGKTVDLKKGTIAMSGDGTSGSGSVIRAYGGGSVNLAGATLTTAGVGNYIAAANVTMTSGTITVADTTALNLVGAASGKKNLADAAAGTFNVTGGTVNVESGGTLNIKGDADFKSGSLKVTNGGKIGLGTLAKGDAARTLKVDSADIKDMLATAGAISGSGDATNEFILKLTDTEADLAGNSIVQGTGVISTGIAIDTAKLTVTGGDAKFLKGKFSGATAFDFNNLTVGDTNTFALEDGAKVTVHNAINVSGDAAQTALSVTSGALTLDGSGSVGAKTLKVSGAGADDAKLNVKGTWTVTDLTLNSGSTNLTNATLTIGGKLTTAEGAVVNADASEINLQGKDASVEFGSGSIALKNTSKLILDKADILKANGTEVDDKKFKAGTVKADANSKIVLNDLSLTKTQYSAFVTATGFNGIFDGITISDHNVSGSVALDQLVTNATAGQEDVQALVDDKAVSGNYTVGNAQLSGEGDKSLELGSGGQLTLVDSSSGTTGKGNFVSKKDGTVADVVMQDTTNSNGLTLAGNGAIGSITTAQAGKGQVTFGTADVSGNVAVQGTVGAKGTELEKVTSNGSNVTVTSGDVYAYNVDINGGSLSLDSGKSLVIGSGSAGLASELNGDVTAGTLTVLGSSGSLSVSEGANVSVTTFNGDKEVLVQVGADTVANGTASLFANSMLLNEGTLFVDPEYGQKYASVAVNTLKTDTTTTDKSAGVVNGKITVGKNAAVGVGFASQAELDAVLANYVDANGSFYQDATKGLTNALVLNKQISLDQTKDGISVDPSAITANATNGKVEIKGGAGLVITDNVYTVNAAGEKQGSAISFTGNTKGDVDVTGAKLVLIGDFSGADKSFSVFGNANAVTGTMEISSANGLLTGTLNAADGTVGLSFDRAAAEAAGAFADASAPVRELLFGKLSGDVKGKGLGFDLLSDVATGSLSGVVADAAAHAATYAGAQQAAVVSVTTMADAMFGRVGSVGVEAASIAATGSQANGGVWLTPMYKSMDADGFNAEGASYGSDVDAAGVAFGADTVNGNMRFGAVFNIGSGDAEGKGNGNGLKDEFDYYGFGIYSAMGFGNFALVGDASMTVISHDVEGLGLKGKADTTAVTMGVTGQYTVATPAVDVTPHLGARFIRLNTDSYDLVGDKGVVATTDFDVQNVFSVPLGVTLSKGFVAGGWTLAPSADLTVTFNTGDTEAKSTTTFTGAPAIGLNTEVLDEVQYGVTLGLGAQNGAFGTSFGINYTGSSNTDSFGVNAQCRYMF